MNVNQRLDRIEQKLDRLLAARDIDPNPGVVIEAGERFAPGSGPIPEVKPDLEIVPTDPAAHIAGIRRALANHPTATPGDTP